MAYAPHPRPPSQVQTVIISVLATLGVLCLLGYGLMYSCASAMNTSLKRAAAESKPVKSPENPPPASDLPEEDAYKDANGLYTFYTERGKLIGWAKGEGDFIVGEIRNDLGRDISGLRLQFDLLEDKAKVREANSYISTLGSGETWKFKCYTWSTKHTSFRFGSLRHY